MFATEVLVSAALLFASAFALPNTSPKNQCTEQLATFDDLTAVPAASELSPIGTYQGIVFNDFDVLSTGVAGIKTGLQPQSGNQVATTGTTNMLMGLPSFQASSSIASFNLEYLYFGCVVDTEETIASTAESCTVSFTAYRANKQGAKVLLGTTSATFTPSNALLSPLAQVVFPSSWTNLVEVDVAVTQATATSLLTGLFIDSVKHCNNAS